MKGPGIAVKSFIVNEKNELLLIKRRDNDPNAAGAWEIPGGRLDLGENPFDGLKRETKEETGIDIEILNSLNVQHFTRDDGQRITMLIFLCKPLSNSIKLSEEHTKYIWANLDEALSKIHDGFYQEIKIYKNNFSK
jgi:8-oxo-dGTP diphosphatase